MLAKRGNPIVAEMLQAIDKQDPDAVLKIWESLRSQ